MFLFSLSHIGLAIINLNVHWLSGPDTSSFSTARGSCIMMSDRTSITRSSLLCSGL